MLELLASVILLLTMSLNDLVQALDLVLLSGEEIMSLFLAKVETTQLLFKIGLGGVVLVLHCQNVLVDRDLIFEEIIQLVDSLPLQ